MPPRLLPLSLLVLAGSMLLAWSGAGSSTDLVIYRCTDAFGQVTVQNDTPCPRGSQQERRTVTAVQSMPAYRAPPVATPTPVPDRDPILNPEPATTDTDDEDSQTPALSLEDRLPPPPLYQCNTYDNDSYLSDSGDPAPRCIPLRVLGIGGNPNLPAGEACQRVTDQCQRIGEAAACEAWHRRLREAEAAARFAPAHLAEENQAEFERIQRVVRESTCGA